MNCSGVKPGKYPEVIDMVRALSISPGMQALVLSHYSMSDIYEKLQKGAGK
jgi:hypothetical protein